MPAIQRPLYYPETLMDREAKQILAIRTRVRTAVGGGARGHFVKPTPASAGMRAPGSASNPPGGVFQPASPDTTKFK
jgi:hypothetical protein